MIGGYFVLISVEIDGGLVAVVVAVMLAIRSPTTTTTNQLYHPTTATNPPSIACIRAVNCLSPTTVALAPHRSTRRAAGHHMGSSIEPYTMLKTVGPSGLVVDRLAV